jgi:hypothetical protein
MGHHQVHVPAKDRKAMRNLIQTRRRSTKATENKKQLGAMSRSLIKSKLY